jgi:cell division septation protein DedD
VAESKPAPSPGKVEPAPVPTRTTTQGGGLKEAIARATQKPTEAVPGGAFTLQISAFQNRPEAERFAAKLRDRGYAPYIVSAEVPNKGTWYRVRMGSFPSKDAASRYLNDFKRETQINAFVAGVN